jgi:adenosine deaminase
MGYIYAEIRFAPLLHTNKGMSQMDAALAALEGLNSALKECPEFEANLILCCMRHAPKEVNLETIEVANKLKGTRVVGVDLAGAEAMHPSSYYKNIFNLAKKYRLNITIHAGEATGSDEVMMALDNGATRIGHGVHLDTKKDGPRAKKEDICFEFCPTSNLQTKSLKSYADVPLRAFMDKGIALTINSDNMTVSNTDVYQEFAHLYETFKLTNEEVYGFLLNSINYAFTSEQVKEKLREELKQRIDKFYLQIAM